MEKIQPILDKYNYFKFAQIQSIQSVSKTSKIVTIVVEDDEGEIINTVKIEFIDVNASRILENSVLPFLDMMSGISIVKEHDLYGFALGQGSAMLHVHNAPLYIICSDVKIEEV